MSMRLKEHGRSGRWLEHNSERESSLKEGV